MSARPQIAVVTLQQSYSGAASNLLVVRAPKAGTIVKFAVKMGTAPSGGAATFDLKKNGVSVLGAALSVADGTTSANTTISVAVSEGDKLTVDLLTTPSSIGNDLTVYFEITETGADKTDAQLLDRANHTGTQTAATISDFSEAVDDRVAALLVAGTNVTLTYDDVSNTLTVGAAGGGGGYTDEQAQDAIGAMIADTATIDLTYTDATPELKADVKSASITEAHQSLSDNTTNDVSTTKHGYAPKAPNDATKFLDGTGAYDTVKDSDLSTSDITTNNASTSKHGFLPKLDNNAAHFLDGTGAWSTPSGSGITIAEIDGSPSGTPSTLQFPNGTVTDQGGGTYRYTPSTSPTTTYGTRVTKSASQSISNNSTTALTFDTETTDDGGFHDTVTNNSRITIPSGKDGYYTLTGQAQFAANATGQRSVAIKKNGSTQIAAFDVYSANGSNTINIPICCTVYLVAGDYVELLVYQNSGGNLNVNSGDANTFFTAVLDALQQQSAILDNAAADIYVATTGSNSNPGTSGSPYLTVAKALSVLPNIITQDHTIHVADGTYAESINLTGFQCVNNAQIKIVGNTTTPANVVFTGTVSQTVLDSAVTCCIAVARGADVLLQGIKVNATADHGIFVHSRARCVIDRCISTGTLSKSVVAWHYSHLEFRGNCTFSGFSVDGIQLLGHCIGTVTVAGTLTITGTGTTATGVHLTNNSQFYIYSPTGCNFTITVCKYGFQLGFQCSFTHQGGSATISITNASTFSSSSAVLCTDQSSFSATCTMTVDHYTNLFEGNSISYLESSGTRNLTNVTNNTTVSQNSVAALL